MVGVSPDCDLDYWFGFGFWSGRHFLPVGQINERQPPLYFGLQVEMLAVATPAACLPPAHVDLNLQHGTSCRPA